MLIHDKVGFFIFVASAIGAVGAVIALFIPFSGILIRIYLRLLALAILVQAVLGGVLYASGHRPSDQLHYVYGAATVLAIPIALGISRHMPWPVRRFWLIGAAILTFGLVLRAFQTG